MHIFWNIWLAFALIFNFYLSLGPIVFPRTQDCWWHYLREFTNEADETLHLNRFSNDAMRFDAIDYITHTHYKFQKTLKNNNLIACYYHVMYAFQSEFTIYQLSECEGTRCSKQTWYLKFKWQQRDSNPQSLSS